MQQDQHLIIFVKNPVLGKVKTRLAATVGDDKALEVYLQLLEITRKATLQMDCVRHVFYSDEVVADDWDDDKFNKFLQQGDDLGARMKNAFEQIFTLGAHKVVIVGSDCPGLTSTVIENSFLTLETNDAVIGPAKDGGYYLLGLKQLHPFLFENKKWSTSTVFQDTVADFHKNGLNYKKAVILSDLDTGDDLYLLD